MIIKKKSPGFLPRELFVHDVNGLVQKFFLVRFFFNRFMILSFVSLGDTGQ